MEGVMNVVRARFEGKQWRWRVGPAMLAGCLLAGVAQAGQRRPVTEPEPPDRSCIDVGSGTIVASPTSVVPGQPSTLTWNVQLPSYCGHVLVKVAGANRPRSGSAVVYPVQPSTYPLRLAEGTQIRDVARASIAMALPTQNGRVVVTITRNDEYWLFLQAIGTPGAYVFLQNHVELDLSGSESLYIANGVTIAGGRTATEPGARIYTRTRPYTFFTMRDDGDGIYGDNVRITGLRIDGGEMGIAAESSQSSFGIVADSRRHIQIDNNEIYGWRGAGIKITDEKGRLSLLYTAMTVRIHDNYIHHNQHDGEQGYGVSVDAGAHALIEKNVFDYNRHAIKSGGQSGTGYLAYRNLVLGNGGRHETIPVMGYTFFTHQFDVHGQQSCLGHLNCGLAGEYFEIRDNSFLYDDGPAIKLRGTPQTGMDVHGNVFAHDELWDSLFTTGALDQTELGLRQWNNRTGMFGWQRLLDYRLCDFDGDGADEQLYATGATWWLRKSPGTYTYLNTSTKRLDEVSLGDVDGDNRCDVVADGVVSSGGRGPTVKHRSDLLLLEAGRLRARRLVDGVVERETYPAVTNGLQFRGTGDFDGDGTDEVVWQDAAGIAVRWRMLDGGYVTTLGSGRPGPEAWRIDAIADFDGDRRADLLWRRADGKVVLWFRGVREPAGGALFPATVTWQNGGTTPDTSWHVKGAGDFDGDGRADILWRHDDGQVAIWYMAGGEFLRDAVLAAPDPAQWGITSVADFDANGRADILWRNPLTGQLALWPDGGMNVTSPSWQNQGNAPDLSWQIVATSDFNGDGRADISWRHTTGATTTWFMQGGVFLSEVYSTPLPAGVQILGPRKEATGGW
jgi:hypothetical protein